MLRVDEFSELLLRLERLLPVRPCFRERRGRFSVSTFVAGGDELRCLLSLEDDEPVLDEDSGLVCVVVGLDGLNRALFVPG